MKTRYEDYIRSIAWKLKRLERLKIDSNKCVRCGHDGTLYRLEIHHKTYERFTKELMEDLETLCVPCHDIETDRMRRERYSKREIKPEILKTQIKQHGKFESKAKRNLSDDYAQRTVIRPVKPIFKGYQGNIGKEEKN